MVGRSRWNVEILSESQKYFTVRCWRQSIIINTAYIKRKHAKLEISSNKSNHKVEDRENLQNLFHPERPSNFDTSKYGKHLEVVHTNREKSHVDFFVLEPPPDGTKCNDATCHESNEQARVVRALLALVIQSVVSLPLFTRARINPTTALPT